MTSRGRLPTLASGLLLAYLLAWMVELASLGTSGDGFDRMQGWAASLPGRIVAGCVWTAAVYHGLEGIRAAFGGDRRPRADLVAIAGGESNVDGPGPEGEGTSAFGSGVLAFLTWALVVPGWVIVLRPWIEDLLR